MIAKWETIKEVGTEDLKIFSVKKVTRRHPEWNREGDFVVLDSPQWINIIPITPDNNVVMIEQYRHGIDEITLEIPGGLVDKNELPRIAAQRECEEETGYIGTEDATLIGQNQPNPAFLNNKCYSYVWFNCEKKSEQNLDQNEDIRVIEIPLDDIPELILKGTIKHSLVLTAFFFYDLKYGLNKK